QQEKIPVAFPGTAPVFANQILSIQKADDVHGYFLLFLSSGFPTALNHVAIVIFCQSNVQRACRDRSRIFLSASVLPAVVILILILPKRPLLSPHPDVPVRHTTGREHHSATYSNNAPAFVVLPKLIFGLQVPFAAPLMFPAAPEKYFQ